MGDRGYNAGGFAYMNRVKCTRCGFSFFIGNRNDRRTCASKKNCDIRLERKLAKEAKQSKKATS